MTVLGSELATLGPPRLACPCTHDNTFPQDHPVPLHQVSEKPGQAQVLHSDTKKTSAENGEGQRGEGGTDENNPGIPQDIRFRPATLVAPDSVEVNLLNKLLAWKKAWVAAGTPDYSASVRRESDHGTVHELQRWQRPPLTKAEKAGISRLYRDQVPVKEIAGRFQVDRRTVRDVAKRAGLDPHPRGLSATQIEQAADRYQAGASLATIGKELGFNDNTVMAALKKFGVPMRPRRGGRRLGSAPTAVKAS